MIEKKNILFINGSASSNSANQKLIEKIASMMNTRFKLTFCKDLKLLPHFDPELSIDNQTKEIIEFRNEIERAVGIILCTPEYIFSIPSGLKNAMEWCISTTLFSGKPLGLITASASGEKAHEELLLIMQTVMAKFTKETTLLIQGIKGKFDSNGELIDEKTIRQLSDFIAAFELLVIEN